MSGSVLSPDKRGTERCVMSFVMFRAITLIVLTATLQLAYSFEHLGAAGTYGGIEAVQSLTFFPFLVVLRLNIRLPVLLRM
jgi:hypothetical protein